MILSNKIKIHPLTVALFFVGLLTGYFKYLFFIFSIVFLHECGHVFMMKLFKRRVLSIELLPFGGITKIDSKISEDIFEDLLIAVGGIFFQTIFGFLLLFIENRGLIDYATFSFINRYNMFIIIFNLVPICPLDGHKIIRLLGELVFSFKKVYKCASWLSLIAVFSLLTIKFEIAKDNLLVFIFLIYMCISEFKNEPFIVNRFLVERLNYTFHYPKKNVKKLDDMYKNRVNYIKNRHEKEVLKEHFANLIH